MAFRLPWPPFLSFDPYLALASARSFSPTLLCLDFHFPEIADCLGPFSASEMASDVHPIASPAELQSHRLILALSLTERLFHSPESKNLVRLARVVERKGKVNFDMPIPIMSLVELCL